LSNEEKTNDHENFEKGMIYMKILKKGGVVEQSKSECIMLPIHCVVSPLFVCFLLIKGFASVQKCSFYFTG
jgi:hypothetical protein